MSISTKILLTIGAILLFCLSGFLVYKHFETAKQLSDIQKSMVEQQQLLDNISRAQSQYASKEDIASFAKQRDIDLSVIAKNLDTLGAQVQAISGITVISKGQVTTNVPSTSVTPRTDPVTPNSNPNVPDPFGYQQNTQRLTLQEIFNSTQIPIGDIGFSAWKDKPWDVNILPRKYLVTSVLGQDENGRHYSYSKFAVQINNKNYDVKIDDNKFLEEYPSAKFSFWNPKVFLFVNGGVGITKVPVTGEFTPGASLQVMSYGQTKNFPTFSILQLGVGYGAINKTLEITVAPISYNLGKSIPLISNTYIGPAVQVNPIGGVTVGLGMSVGL